MTFEQITTLLDRGFTPDQITLLTTSGDPTTPDSGAAADDSFHPQETEPAAPPSPDPDPAPAPAPDPAPAADMNCWFRTMKVSGDIISKESAASKYWILNYRGWILK